MSAEIGLNARYEQIRDYSSSQDLPQTEWTVVTGGTSCWKTTVCSILAEDGYPIVDEAHRTVLEKVKSLHSNSTETFAEFRSNNEGWVRETILDITSQREAGLQDFKDSALILERAVPDQLSWFTWSGLEERLVLDKIGVRYKGVARLALAPFIEDDVRIVDENRRRLIHELLRFDYEALGYPVADIVAGSSIGRAHELREILPNPPSPNELEEIRHGLITLGQTTDEQIEQLWSDLTT